MSNSPLVTYTKISPNKTSPRKYKIDTITIHCIVGQWTAKQGCDYFANPERKASSNYVVGKDGSIGLSVSEKDRAWTSGGKLKANGITGSENDHRAVTIEVASDTYHPYKITDKALNALVELCTDICKRNNIKRLLWEGDKALVGNISRQNMTVHRWFENKACPGDYLYNLHSYIAQKVNENLIKEEDENMDSKRFKELWLEMRKELQDNDSSQYSEEARKWAVSKGLVTGGSSGEFNGMWEDILTREQLITVLYRFAKILGLV